jgi:hypothetical protein
MSAGYADNGKHEIRGRVFAGLVYSLACFLAICACDSVWGGTAGLPEQGQAATDGRWALLVSGISGDPELQKEYLKEIVDLRGILEGQLGFPSNHVIALFDKPDMDPAHIQSLSNRENLARACKDIAGRAGKEDLIFIFLEGHGDFDGKSYKFNLVGPDPTGEDLAALFYAIPARRYIVVNATNCSGGSQEALTGKGKTVITATKSGNEKNLTHFGRFFVDAFAANNADVDKNGRVSVFEAFNYAARKVEEYYTKDGSLQTEHPVINENGAAHALALSEIGERDALLSRAAYLDRGSPATTQTDLSPEAQALAKEAQALEKQIELLKSAKDEMGQADYEKKLEDLLVKLAEVHAKLRKK